MRLWSTGVPARAGAKIPDSESEMFIRHRFSLDNPRTYMNGAQICLRRNLPHYQWQNKVYFVTFSTYNRERLTAGSRDIVLETCLLGNGKSFQLHAAVIMPDHVHLLFTPLADRTG
jgi:hypothetical protein